MEYHEIRQKLGKFAAVLLDQCQTRKEVEYVLRKDHRGLAFLSINN